MEASHQSGLVLTEGILKSGVLGSGYLQNIVGGGSRSQQGKTRRTQRESGIQLIMPTHAWFRGMDHKWRDGW